MPHISPASLKKPRSAKTMRLRWLMNEAQRAEIADRLRDLRDNSAETNRSIADYVAVSERTVAAWAGAEQGMTYDHAKKVAELFKVDIDWLWRGREKGPTPDPFASGSDGAAEAVQQLAEQVADLARDLAATRTKLLSEIAKVQKAQSSERKPKRRRAQGS